MTTLLAEPLTRAQRAGLVSAPLTPNDLMLVVRPPRPTDLWLPRPRDLRRRSDKAIDAHRPGPGSSSR